MVDKNETVNIDEVMFPSFRFHPTDDELVGFCLRRKIQQRPLHIELIKQVDIYKYDPWDLPSLTSTGENKIYFTVQETENTGIVHDQTISLELDSGFTGTDRPIYSSDSTTKCIGLKKCLVFYTGQSCQRHKN